ncbi:hypothetical protein [Streptomyces sp. NPDC093589]|uniref:hypothetical protein n=1 Tax=Streptomyces sp. NPDC093589 TaxID=3366043 RepID=UPI0037F2300B
MIEYMAHSGPNTALNCPIFICDFCRQQITGQGNVVWGEAGGYDGTPRQRTPIFATHKDCDHKFIGMFRKIYPVKDGWRDLWDDIGDFVKQLAHNATRSLEEQAGESHPHIVAMPLVRNWGQLPEAEDSSVDF